MLLYKRLTLALRTWTESKGKEKGLSCKWNQKKAWVAILISDKNRP